ncbi:uncharacterized protein LOC142814011 [Rhipicephalus microplus]|uniref:uncharacterized protein LOC142814011 n=1 Tax=Rhipicephalus microplus TaxID=6941 RepID=UPI003F6CE525
MSPRRSPEPTQGRGNQRAAPADSASGRKAKGEKLKERQRFDFAAKPTWYSLPAALLTRAEEKKIKVQCPGPALFPADFVASCSPKLPHPGLSFSFWKKGGDLDARGSLVHRDLACCKRHHVRQNSTSYVGGFQWITHPENA